MFNVVLYQPEIPPNTGNVIRLCANTGCTLHLVRPLGFDIDHRALRRAGLDYHEFAALFVHDDLDTALAACGEVARFTFSTHHRLRFDQVRYPAGAVLLFGPESRGLPAPVRTLAPEEGRVRLPMQPGSRSLNLSNTVAVAVYEAWRQHAFGGAA